VDGRYVWAEQHGRYVWAEQDRADHVQLTDKTATSSRAEQLGGPAAGLV